MEEAASIEETLILEWTTAVEALDSENMKELFDIRPSLLWTPLLPLAHLETDFSHFVQRLKGYKLLGTSIRPLYALHHILFDYGVPDDEWAPERIELVEYILKNTKDNELNTCFWGTEENTVMHLAFFLQQTELIQQLRDYGAVSTIPNKNGFLPTIPDSQPEVKLLVTKTIAVKDKSLTTNASDRFKRLRELAESPNVSKPATTERQNSTRRYFRPGHLEERKRRVLSEEEEAELEKKIFIRQKEVDQLAQRSAVKNNPLFKKFEEQKQQKELEAKRTPSLTAASAVRDRKKLLGAADQIRRTSRVINSLKDRSYVSSSVFRQAQDAEAAANGRSGKSLLVPTLAQLRGSPVASPNVSDNEEEDDVVQRLDLKNDELKEEDIVVEPEVKIVQSESKANDSAIKQDIAKKDDASPTIQRNKQDIVKKDNTSSALQRNSNDDKRGVTEDELESLAIGRLGDRDISSNLKLTKKEIDIASSKVKDIVNVHEHLNDEDEREIYSVGKTFEVWKKGESGEDTETQKITSVKQPDKKSVDIVNIPPSTSKESLSKVSPVEKSLSISIDRKDNENSDKERSPTTSVKSKPDLAQNTYKKSTPAIKDSKQPELFAVKDKVQLVNEILATNEKNAAIAIKEKPEVSYAYKNISVEKLAPVQDTPKAEMRSSTEKNISTVNTDTAKTVIDPTKSTKMPNTFLSSNASPPTSGIKERSTILDTTINGLTKSKSTTLLTTTSQSASNNKDKSIIPAKSVSTQIKSTGIANTLLSSNPSQSIPNDKEQSTFSDRTVNGQSKADNITNTLLSASSQQISNDMERSAISDKIVNEQSKSVNITSTPLSSNSLQSTFDKPVNDQATTKATNLSNTVLASESRSISDDKERVAEKSAVSANTSTVQTTIKSTTLLSTPTLSQTDEKVQNKERSTFLEKTTPNDNLEILVNNIAVSDQTAIKQSVTLKNSSSGAENKPSSNATVKDQIVTAQSTILKDTLSINSTEKSISGKDDQITATSATLLSSSIDKPKESLLHVKGDQNLDKSVPLSTYNTTEKSRDVSVSGEGAIIGMSAGLLSIYAAEQIKKTSGSDKEVTSSQSTSTSTDLLPSHAEGNGPNIGSTTSLLSNYTTEASDKASVTDQYTVPSATLLSNNATEASGTRSMFGNTAVTPTPSNDLEKDAYSQQGEFSSKSRKITSFSSESSTDDDYSVEYEQAVNEKYVTKSVTTSEVKTAIVEDKYDHQSDAQSEYLSDYEYDASSFLDNLTFADDIVTKTSPIPHNEKPTIHIEQDTSDEEDDLKNTPSIDPTYYTNNTPEAANHVVRLEISTNKSQMMIEEESDDDGAATPTLATFQKSLPESSDDEESRNEWKTVYNGLMSDQQAIEFEDDILEQRNKTNDPSRVSISSDLDETSILQTLTIQNEQRLSKWANKRQSGSQRNHWSIGIQDAMKRESMLSKGGESVAASEASSDQWYDPDDEWNEQEEMRRQSMLVTGFQIPPKDDDYATNYYYNGGREEYKRHSDSSINTNSETYSYKNSNSTENTNLDEDEEDERKLFEPDVIQEYRPLQHDVIEEEDDYYSNNLHVAATADANKTRGESSYYHGGQSDNEQEEGEIVVFMDQISTPVERQVDTSYNNAPTKPLTNFSASTLSVNQREDDEVSLIKVPSRTVAIAEVGSQQEDVPHDPNNPRVEDISHYMNKLPAFEKHNSESAVRGGSAFDTSAVEGGFENESVVMKRAISTTQQPGQPVEQSRGIPNAHEINSECLAVEKRPSQDDRKISMSSLEVSSFGKMYIGVSGAHNMLLPLPKEITYVRCVISDGEYEYMSRYEVLGHQILMDYECVIDTRPGMIITVSLHVRPDYHVKPRTGWSKWFTSIRKQKEHLSGYVHPEDGAIGQTRFAVDHMVPGCYKKTYEAHFDCFNSWYARTTRERARREQFGDDEDFLKIVGKLNVEMLYLPVSNPSVQVPRSLRECDLTLKIRQWHDTCWQSGYLSTRRQGLKIWERHYYRLIGSQLIGYTSDGGDRQVWDHYNMSDVIRLSAAADKVIVTLLGDGEEDKVFGHETIHAENHKGFFRLAFPDYHLDCVSDDLEESEEWVKTLKSMIGRVPLRLPFSD